MKPYQVGQIVLMNFNGWLKAFRVIAAHQIDAENFEYQMQMVEMEKGPQWMGADGAM